ncbi:hypothetical protein [Sphingomonas asaccharolytica]|nr:hypothetical protein [Sphingomonas asaccharolytica]
MMAWLREMLGSLFQDQPDDESRDIDRIREMLDYLKDVPYVPGHRRPIP